MKLSNEKMTASVVIPVYNGEGTIGLLVDELEETLPDCFSQFEIILVNDGSPDQSRKVIGELSEKYPSVIGINLMRNYGQHNATLCGIRQAQYDIIITMDDDLQHPPKQIPLMLEELEKGYDVVYAIPKKLPHSPWRNFASKATKRVLGRIMGIPITEIGAFRIFYTRLRDAFATYCSPEVYIDPLLTWGTSKFGHVMVEEDKRTVGHSNYSFSKLVKAGLLILTGYSTAPMRFASAVGFLFMLFGLGILIYVFVINATLGSIPGFPFLASIVALFSGVQLFSLGIIGEYLSRVYDRSTDRPAYIIESTKKDE